MSDKTVVITGASGSIGYALAESLARQEYKVIMACRSELKARPLLQQIIDRTGNSQIEFLSLDLASVSSIREFSTVLIQRNLSLTALVNNAGVMNKVYRQTAEGYELTIGVNYLGTTMLTCLLLPLLSAGSTIVNTISVTRKMGHLSDTLFESDAPNYSRFRAYANSKLALTLFTARLSQQLASADIHVSAADPGVVDSNMITMQQWFDPLADLLFRPFIKSPEAGAYPALSALQSGKSGYLFSGRSAHPLSAAICNHPQGEWLWRKTADLLAPYNVYLPGSQVSDNR